ncbi:hypothetical protein BSP239C_02476 [Brevibacterium sp. 239c]|nr:hypothetical protein BSP239C_02476 [Brevibacterium sp. 239c]
MHPILTGHTCSEVFTLLIANALAEYVETRVSACIWEGWANDEEPSGCEPFRYRGRTYAKCSIVLRDLNELDAEYGPVSLVWPADQSWCIYNDIDTIDTFVGGSIEVVDAIKAVRGLETFDGEQPASPHQPHMRRQAGILFGQYPRSREDRCLHRRGGSGRPYVAAGGEADRPIQAWLHQLC